jgi:hypothetical protein
VKIRVLHAASMPATLPAPHIPTGFPLLAATGGQTVHPDGQTVLRIEASDHTARGTGVGGLTASPGG